MATRKAKIEGNIAELVSAFPLSFSTEPEQIKPLGIGIKQRIYARCTLSHREVSAALRRYTGRVAYLHAIVEGAVRVDLDGTPSGNVTAREAAYAAKQIKRILAKAAGKPKKEIKPNALVKGNIPQPPAISDALKCGPRRLGLADLKQAAAARRGPSGTGDTRRLEGLYGHKPDEHSWMNDNSSS
jgi:ProP effector